MYRREATVFYSENVLIGQIHLCFYSKRNLFRFFSKTAAKNHVDYGYVVSMIPLRQCRVSVIDQRLWIWFLPVDRKRAQNYRGAIDYQIQSIRYLQASDKTQLSLTFSRCARICLSIGDLKVLLNTLALFDTFYRLPTVG